MRSYDEHADADHFDEASDIDWQRSQVSSRAQIQDPNAFTGLGDPTRWGSESSIAVTSYGDKATPQLVRVQADDAYPRNWQLIGHIEMDLALASAPPSALAWAATLDLEMGIGQAIVSHRVNLRALVNLAVTPALLTTGLAWYYPTFNGSRIRYPWVLPGGIVARSLSARATISISGAGEAPISLPQTVDIACAISPFASGHGL